MKNPDYTVLVHGYFLGQFRIQLTDRTLPAPGAPEGHGDIVRELCTYKPEIMEQTLAELAAAADPPSYCESKARPWNCEYPGGRIRLDNVPGDRIEIQSTEEQWDEN